MQKARAFSSGVDTGSREESATKQGDGAARRFACRFGIEEEYFLSDAATRGAVRHMPAAFFSEVKAAFPEEVQREMLQSQIEVATPVCDDMGQARTRLSRLRAGLAGIALGHDMLLCACGTHPSASWARQRVTDVSRYDRIMRDLQMLGSRNQLCGMHIHVEVPDEDERIRLMGRIVPFLPLLLALSTSSPFWQGHRTGLMGYRLAAYAELPRTGLPELFAGADEYRAYVKALVSSGAIRDASYIWWAVRPSEKHPTLELRVCDSCTRIEDTLAIAALYRCLVHHLLRQPELNASLTAVSRGVAAENLWRAQRYGVHGGLVDEAQGRIRPLPDIVSALIARLGPDAAALGCRDELEHCAAIARQGTSADAQLAVFEEARSRPGGRAGALAAVVDWLASRTRSDAAGVGVAGMRGAA